MVWRRGAYGKAPRFKFTKQRSGCLMRCAGPTACYLCCCSSAWTSLTAIRAAAWPRRVAGRPLTALAAALRWLLPTRALALIRCRTYAFEAAINACGLIDDFWRAGVGKYTSESTKHCGCWERWVQRLTRLRLWVRAFIKALLGIIVLIYVVCVFVILYRR